LFAFVDALGGRAHHDMHLFLVAEPGLLAGDSERVAAPFSFHGHEVGASRPGHGYSHGTRCQHDQHGWDQPAHSVSPLSGVLPPRDASAPRRLITVRMVYHPNAHFAHFMSRYSRYLRDIWAVQTRTPARRAHLGPPTPPV